EAKALYESILQSEQDHPKALLGLGRVLMNEGDTVGALKSLEQIPLITEERKDADRLIAQLKLQSGASQDESALRATLESDPTNLEGRFNLAQALAANGNYEEALK